MSKSRISYARWTGLAVVMTLALTGCGKGCTQKLGGGGGGASKGAMELIPSDRNAVIGLNWKKIDSSPLGPQMKKDMPPEVVPLAQDIEDILVGVQFKGPANGEPNFVAVISGKLDSTKILAEINKQAQKDGVTLTTEDYEGVKLHLTPKDPNVAVAFLDDKAIVGHKDAIKKSIDLSKKKGESIQSNKAVMDLVNSVDKGRMVWAVAAIPPGLIPAGDSQPGNPMASLSNMKAIDLALDYADNLVLDLGIVTASESDAKQLQTMATSYQSLFGPSLVEKDPSFGKLLSGLTINSKGDRLVLSLKLDKATVEELSKKAPAAAFGGAPGGPPAGAPMGDPMADPGMAPPPPSAPAPAPEAVPPAPPAPAAAAPQ